MMLVAKQWLRFAVVVVLLAATALFLHHRSQSEIVRAGLPLSSFPLQIGDWQGTTLPIAADDLAILGPGEFLMRDYRASSGDPVNLYIAYFPSQRMGDGIHSPKNCLPGSGWTPLESGQLSIRNDDGSTISVNRYIVAQGLSRGLVLYWYQAHGRVTASEYVAKVRFVEDSISMNRTDGALVRIVVPFTNQSDLRMAQQTALAFIARIRPMLDAYIPR